MNEKRFFALLYHCPISLPSEQAGAMGQDNIWFGFSHSVEPKGDNYFLSTDDYKENKRPYNRQFTRGQSLFDSPG
jgi:hypothetical protein